MSGTLQPLDQKFPIVDKNGNPTRYFTEWAQQKQIDIGASITLQDVIDYLTAHKLVAGVGIQFAPDGNINNSPTIHADVQAILDEVTATRGALLYRGLLGWAALLPGTANQLLQTNGAGADPTWVTPSSGGGGALILVEQHAGPGGAGIASLDFTTGITATYDEYLIEIVNMQPVALNARPWIRMSTNGGVSFDSAAVYTDYYHSRNRFNFQGNGSEVDTKIVTMASDHENAHSIGINGYIRLYSPLSTTLFKCVMGEFTINNGGGFIENCQFSGWYRNLTAVNAIQFLASTGNIATGNIRMYGIAK